MDYGVYVIHPIDDQFKLAPESIPTNSSIINNYFNNVDVKPDKKQFFDDAFILEVTHYLTLAVLGILIWITLWCAFGDGWRWSGPWSKLVAVYGVAWLSGIILESLTSLPPLLAALLTGILARNFGIIDMRDYLFVDMTIRKIYPVLILGKGSLGWYTTYIKDNWQRVVALGCLPWLAEVVTLAVCTHLLLDFPWIWGFLLGSFYASVSCPVIMSTVGTFSNYDGGKRNWTQFVCTAGGLDTTLSVGVYGFLLTFMFYETNDVYRYAKAALALPVGTLLGVIWGTAAGYIPHKNDFFVSELRVMFVLVGGLFTNFFTSLIGWGGTGAVAVLACNATAARQWSKMGWKLNKNPASTAYRVMWTAVEPALFAYTGTFFVLNQQTYNTILLGFGILVICLTVRLTVVCLTCWDMCMLEKILVCFMWTPKSIVEAVLGPVTLGTLLSKGLYTEDEKNHAEDMLRLIVQAILITTPISFLLTSKLGPILLRKIKKDFEDGISEVNERRKQ